MTDAPPRGEQRGLAAAPAPEQAQATGKWRDNIRRGGSGASQSEQPGKRGSQRRTPGAPNDKMSSNRGCRGHPRRGCCEREPESDRVSICPEAGSFPQARCDFGEFSVNQPLYFSARIY